MIKDYFEVTHRDVAGRIGKLKTPHGVVETPNVMPVVNPNIEFLSCEELRTFGAQIVITNAYILYRTKEPRKFLQSHKLHELLKTDMPIMTDSGSYQLMVYGDVEVENSEILNFQKEIGSDIAVPLDIPTPPDADTSLIEEDMGITLSREVEAAKIFEDSESILAFPIQGSTNLRFRCEFAKKVLEIAENHNIRCVFPIGGIVPLLDSYRFLDVVRIILEVKSAISPSVPIHLFGAGHPMIFAVAVALGCDLFDSAAYALYAKDDRYMTVRGTEKLEELNEFPCNCPVCSSYTPVELKKMEKEERAKLLARHNLYVTFQEIKTIKQAIRSKTLFELVENRIRGHPYLLAAWRILREEKYSKFLELFDAGAKSRFFYTGVESIFRPAVKRYSEKVLNVKPKDVMKVSTDMSSIADAYLKPVFGIIFPELMECYPAGHAELPNEDLIDLEALEAAVDNFLKYVRKYSNTKFIVEVKGVWKKVLSNLPKNVEIVDLED